MRRKLTALFLALTMLVSMAPAVFATGGAFSDVPADAWYSEAVAWAVENGITGGIGNGLFGPDQTCTRGQVVTFLWAAAGKPVPKSTDNPFTDVIDSDWYYNAVMWAVENNITGGTSATTFSPEAACTRAAVVTFLYAAEGKPAISEAENSFSDVSSGDWFYAPVMWAVANDITGGIGNALFGPDNACTRAQIALFLYKASLVGEETPVVTPNPATVGMGYAVCELEFADTERQSLRAVVSAESACVLVTEVLNEDGTKQLTRVETDIAAGTVLESIEVQLPESVTLPEYVLLRGSLQDADGTPLCDFFVSRDYTEAHIRFAALMETDFAPERVIDVVEENDGNFVVIHEDVLRIAQTDTVNVLRSRADGVCVFEQADETLRSLKAGDKILMTDMDGQYAGVIVDEINIGADGVVEIREKADVGISDFYTLIKIEANLTGQPQTANTEPQMQSEDMGPLFWESDRKYLKEIEMGPALSNDIKTIAGCVETTISVGAKLKYEYDPELLGKDYLEYAVLAAVIGELDLTIAPNVNTGDSIEIASVPLVGLKKFAKVPAELSFVYEIDCEVGGDITVGVEAVTGFVYQTGAGVQRVEYKETIQRECNFKESIEMKFGLRASIGAEFFDGMFEVYLGAECGIDLTGELYVLGSIQLDTDSYHACQGCLGGYAKGYFEIEIVAEYDIDEWLSGTALDLDLLRVGWNIGAFHLSIMNTDDSVYEGRFVFDWGECPNRKYRVQVTTYQNDEEVHAMTKLRRLERVGNLMGELICEQESPFDVYVYPGTYEGVAEIGIQTAYKKFSVGDEQTTVELKVEDPVVSGFVFGGEDRDYLFDAEVVVQKDGVEVCSVPVDDWAMYSVSLKPGTYTLICSAEEYYSETKTLTLDEDTDYSFVLAEREPGEVTGTVSEIKTVNGSQTYVPVREAVVTVYSREDRVPLVTVRMDAIESGVFSFDLPKGDYSLMVVADGYDSYETDFTLTSKDVELPVVLMAAGTKEAAYAAYVPMVERAIEDTNDGFSFDATVDNDLAQGYLEDLDGDGIEEMLMCYYYNGYRVYSLYDYENDKLVKVVERKKLIQAMAGGELGSAAIVYFDGAPTVMIMDMIGAGGGAGVTHLYNYEFYDYPSLERKYLLGYWQEEGEQGIAKEKFYINDEEVTKEHLILDMTRCEELKYSQRGYDFYNGDPMSLKELLKALRGPVIVKGAVYENKFVEGVTKQVPIPHAEIKLWCWDDETETEIRETVYADEKGCFEVDLTEVGAYDAKISADGYIAKTATFSEYDVETEVSVRLVPDDYEAVAQDFMDRKGYQYMDGIRRERSRGMLCDMNGDGQDELVMRAAMKYGKSYQFTYEIWTISDGQTKLLLEYSPQFMAEYLSIAEYNGKRYFAIEEVSPGSMAASHDLYYYNVDGKSYEVSMQLSYWEMYDESEGTYSIDGRDVGAAEFKQLMAQITTVFDLFDEWEGGYDGYPLYELVYQEVG